MTLPYEPIIKIYEDRIEVYGYGVRRYTHRLRRYCIQSETIIPYICMKDNFVMLAILETFKKMGVEAVRICKNGVCKEVELVSTLHEKG
jgi:hypothetical protein